MTSTAIARHAGYCAYGFHKRCRLRDLCSCECHRHDDAGSSLPPVAELLAMLDSGPRMLPPGPPTMTPAAAHIIERRAEALEPTAAPPAPGAALGEELRRLELAVGDQLWDAIDQAAAEGPEGLAWLLRRVHVGLEALKDAYGTVEGILADVLPGGFLTIDGLGTFERKEGATRKEWNRDAAAVDVLEVLQAGEFVDPETGEVGEWPPGARLAARRCAEALAVAFRFEPRAGNTKAGTGLRAAGLNPDSYCTTEPGRVRVIATWADLPGEVRE